MFEIDFPICHIDPEYYREQVIRNAALAYHSTDPDEILDRTLLRQMFNNLLAMTTEDD